MSKSNPSAALKAYETKRPDFVLFDLDPGKVAFADAVAVALKFRLQAVTT